jgi:hypothetical protein
MRRESGAWQVAGTARASRGVSAYACDMRAAESCMLHHMLSGVSGKFDSCGDARGLAWLGEWAQGTQNVRQVTWHALYAYATSTVHDTHC